MLNRGWLSLALFLTGAVLIFKINVVTCRARSSKAGITYRVSEKSLIGLLIFSCYMYCNKEDILGLGNITEYSVRQNLQRSSSELNPILLSKEPLWF